MTTIKPNCKLLGFYGPFEAYCHPLETGEESYRITSLDKGIDIRVRKSIVDAKFSECEKPEFYYS